VSLVQVVANKGQREVDALRRLVERREQAA
jgi:hypothetical protein